MFNFYLYLSGFGITKLIDNLDPNEEFSFRLAVLDQSNKTSEYSSVLTVKTSRIKRIIIFKNNKINIFQIYTKTNLSLVKIYIKQYCQINKLKLKIFLIHRMLCVSLKYQTRTEILH